MSGDASAYADLLAALLAVRSDPATARFDAEPRESGCSLACREPQGGAHFRRGKTVLDHVLQPVAKLGRIAGLA